MRTSTSGSGGDASGSDALWLFRFIPRVARLQEMALKDLDPPLSFGQFRVLQRIEEGESTLTEITRAGTLSLPTLAERIQGVVRKKLVRRVDVAGDRRASRLTLTTLGRDTLARAHRRLETLAAWLLRDIADGDRLRFHRTTTFLDARVVDILRRARELDSSLSDLMAQERRAWRKRASTGRGRSSLRSAR